MLRTAILLAAALVGCEPHQQEKWAIELLAKNAKWTPVTPGWSCDDAGCGTLRGTESEKARFQMRLHEDGRFERDRDGCAKGSWELANDILTMHFDDGHVDEWVVAKGYDFLLATRKGASNDLDTETWHIHDQPLSRRPSCEL